MVRLVLGPDGDVAADMAGGAFGRGAHVHPDPECLKQACKGGLSRSFKTKVVADAGVLADRIVAGCDRRAVGLLLAARGAGVLAIGADATIEALENGAKAVVVACDAASVAQKVPIANAVAQGRAVAWGDKGSLGALLGREEVAVCAVRDAGIAARLITVVSVRSRCFACSRSEVR
jgi:predicted RNA-binding protein YlxR (DUF448 family)/ribosomal protein L30E